MSTNELVAFEVTPQTPPIRFLASLSDGRTVIQDDRPGEMHAWHRLKAFLQQNPELSITGLRLQAIHLAEPFECVAPSNQRGYVFGKKALAAMMSGGAELVGLGYWDGDKAYIQWFCNPDMSGGFPEVQNKTKCGFKLIENP